MGDGGRGSGESVGTGGYAEFFARATAGLAPYPYQERLAAADDAPHLLRVPTGAGKTAAAIVAWLYRLAIRPRATPRRLVYCLPMRVLVEQTEREARRWIENLGIAVPVHVLMGGVDSTDWFLGIDQPALLIGTQDMLLSRALNRGYAASRFHWPIDFGLLNNDCTWILDEPQLMGSGVSTSAQLAGLRQTLGTFGSCRSVWMSATLEPSWLETIDFRGKFPGGPLELQAEDYDPARPLFKRMTAAKTLVRLGPTSTKDMKDIARRILDLAVARRGEVRSPSRTLVVVNTVGRANALYSALYGLTKKSASPELLLIHSRFRRPERQILTRRLQEPSSCDRIIVATQVVEAGVDLSAHTLVTELAPWSSLVQRMGRCNRTGTDSPGAVYWIDLDEKSAEPYSLEDLALAREHLAALEGQGVSPRDLDEFKMRRGMTLSFVHTHVLRRRDVLDLFDTTPDLSGNDIDIQRFVRGDDADTDVQVFWRPLAGDAPSPDSPAPARAELCSVPVGQVRSFLKTLADKGRGACYTWDHLDGRWARMDSRDIRPGLTILMASEAGGYDWSESARSGRGWDPDSTSAVPTHVRASAAEEGAGSDPNSALAGEPLTIAQHTRNVCQELDAILAPLDLVERWKEFLRQAARDHDIGKAHPVFQRALRTANPALASDELWAKSGVRARLLHDRKHFRHELASALAVLQAGAPFAVAYLVAAHHGRVRLAIRALPGEDQPRDQDVPFALGVHHGDVLPAVEVDGSTSPETALDLSPMRLGGPASWTSEAMALLGELGPFKLAYFEAVLRAADVRASRQEAQRA